MLRKIIFGSVAALSFALPTGLTSSADARGPVPAVNEQGHHWHVYYRRCCHEPWRVYGCFDCICEAREAAHQLEHQGFYTRVRCSD